MPERTGEFFAPTGTSTTETGADAPSPDLVVHGDLDHAIGSISHPGSVRIHGNVEPDAEVRAAGSIRVDGHVRGGRLIAGGSIRILGCVDGPGRSRLDAIDDIEIGGARLAEIVSGGDIRCERTLVQCSTRARGRILLDGALAHLSGGEVHAMGGLRVSRIGSSLGRPTAVLVGEAVDVEDAESIRMRLKMCIESTARVARKIDQSCARFDALPEGRTAALEGIRRLVKERSRTLRLQSSLVRKRRQAGDRPEGDAPLVAFTEVLPGVTLDSGRGPHPVPPTTGGGRAA